jgi:hypothetical protein
MPAFNKFNLFVQDLEEGKHAFTTTGTYKVMLTNTAPVATNHVYADISATELAAGNGYTTGGDAVTVTDANVTGTETVSGASVTWTASGAGMGPFRYAVLYRSDLNFGLVGWWDNGSAITIGSGNQFQVSWSSGIFTLA